MFQVKDSGFPKFRKKNIRDSFYLEGNIRISGNKIKLPTIGWVKCHEVLRGKYFPPQTPHEQLPTITLKNATISKRAGKWFVAFKLDSVPINNQSLGEKVGVDLGINTLATCSNGFTVENPKVYAEIIAGTYR